MLVNANLNIIAKEVLEPEDFYDNKMRIIFEVFFLSKAPEKLSAIDIAQKTKIDFIELSELMMSLVSQREQEFRSTCYLIKDLSYKRKHEALITKIKKQLSDGADLDDIQAEYDRFFASIDTKQNEILSSNQLAKMTYESFMQNVTNGLKVIKTGYVDFDKIFGGLISDDYIILAARTSVGKSSFATVPHSIHANVSIGAIVAFPVGDISAEIFLNIKTRLKKWLPQFSQTKSSALAKSTFIPGCCGGTPPISNALLIVISFDLFP